MTTLLFKLRGVPDDEADEVRALLTDNGIDYYETPAGRWGISVPALWVRDDGQLKAARALVDHYEAERAARMRAEYEKLLREGGALSLAERFKREPIKYLLYLLAIAVVIYLSTVPFLALVK